MDCHSPHLKASTLILFIAFTAIGITQLSIQHDPEWSELLREDQSDFILTESNSSFSCEYVATRITNIEIASITTNNTPISLVIMNETNTKLSMDNVTRLRGLSVKMNPQPPEVITITVSRKNQTASVRLEILILQLAPPPAAMPRMIPIIPSIVIIGAFVLGYNLIRFRNDCWNPFLKQKDSPSKLDQIVPLALIVVPLVGGAMVSPFLSDITGNQYQLIERETVLDQRSITDTLTEADPMKNYSLYSIADSYNSSIQRLRIHSFEVDDSPIFMRGEFEDESIDFVIESTVDSPIFWFEPDFEIEPSILYFERIESDVQYSFVIDIIGTEMVPETDPTVPSILAMCGLFMLTLAIYRAWRIEDTLKNHIGTEDGLESNPR